MAFLLDKLNLPTSKHWWALAFSIGAAFLVFSFSAVDVYSKLVVLSILVVGCAVVGVWFIRNLLLITTRTQPAGE
ncbi:hypothetical protein D3C81_1581010 [compost metagenome]